MSHHLIHSRRNFLKQAAAVSLGFGGLESLFKRTAFAGVPADEIPVGFGPLLRDPHRIMDLPEGFTYRVVSWVGDSMDDGLLVPGDSDGMAAFPGPDGLTVLIRNHEISPGDNKIGAFGGENERLGQLNTGLLYDAGFGKTPGLGGTSTVHFDTRTGEVKRQFMSLAGTVRNCAGGPTPWNSWITCEETVLRTGDLCEKDHGFCFEVPASASGLVTPVALTAMGRFNHEAIAVDPKSGCVYLTEDRPDGLLYRFIPNVPGQMAQGGRLQALAFKERPSADSRNWNQDIQVKIGETIAVQWIDIADPLSPNDDMRQVGFTAGAARFARGEGMWYGNDSIYFACTNGGPIQKGQIWRYHPSAAEGTDAEHVTPGYLQLAIESQSAGLLDNADNITVSPWGDLVVCEDGSGEQFLVGVTPEGKIYKFGRNATARNSELAGATFSPDGTTLFVNIQHDGITLAITGPWERRMA